MSALFPSSDSGLVAAGKSLFAESQRNRSETTDDGISPYILQRRKFYNPDQWMTLLTQLSQTTTLYVGNLSFYTSEEQLYEFFSTIGSVLKIIMGLNQLTMTPCGFCFVEFATHQQALDCQRHCSGLMIDERVIRADLDPGFEEGRQFGRSKITGGQRRDDHRLDFDAGRGGYVLNQTNTFSSFLPGVVTQVASYHNFPYHRVGRARKQKRQKIDLAAVRAQRMKDIMQQATIHNTQATTSITSESSIQPSLVEQQLSDTSMPTTGTISAVSASIDDTNRVGRKRSRRDDDEAEEEEPEEDDYYNEQQDGDYERDEIANDDPQLQDNVDIDAANVEQTQQPPTRTESLPKLESDVIET